MTVQIGTCGYSDYKPPGNWKEKYDSKLQAYADDFPVVELNRTFYKLPMTKTAKRWRKETGADFEFTLKAWQAITHSTDSPTWRNKKGRISEKQERYFGDFRPNSAVMDAWQETKKRAQALASRVVVLQSPPSFNCTRKHEKNIRRFVEKIERDNICLAWEPRGDWNDSPDRIKAICRSMQLTHVVDPLRRSPLSDGPVAYLRLHGLNEKETDIRYEYDDEELEQLAAKLRSLERRCDRVYCMFNNTEKFGNAEALRSIFLK